MIRKLIILFVSFIISLPLFADAQIILNSSIEGQLAIKRYYAQISEENDITTGDFYIDQDGVHTSLNEVSNPFNLRDGFTTEDFIVTFIGTVNSSLSPKVDVSISSYYYIDGSSNIFISSTPEIIDKEPSNGIINLQKGVYYDSTNSNLPTFSFNIRSPELPSISAGRYLTDVTISVSEY